MTHDEAIKTIKEALRVASMWIPDDSSGDTKALFKALAALDSLAVQSKDLDPAIQMLVQENFWGLAGKPEAVEPSEDAREFVFEIANVDSDDFLANATALITARDHKIIEQYRKSWREQLDEAHADREACDELIRRECKRAVLRQFEECDGTAGEYCNDGKWYMGKWGCDTLDHIIAAIMGEAKK